MILMVNGSVASRLIATADGFTSEPRIHSDRVDDLLAARSQMAMSLAFHIVFAAVGIAMPLLMFVAEGRWLRTRNPVFLELARRWARGTAVMFAVGAVSGTVLSFELGLLWPTFMKHAGAVVGMPFSLEGFAFFMEAIFLGIYLYGWDRVPEKVHWLSGLAVLASGVASGAFVVTANAWMNTPEGFEIVNGEIVDIKPFRAMLNPAAPTEVVHMTIAAFLAVGLGVAGIHAWRLLHDPDNPFHLAAYRIALPLTIAMAIAQPISGDFSARHVAKFQPVKLAALEGQWETERYAPLRIGGWPDEESRSTRWAVELPALLSLLAFHDPRAEVRGLEAFDPSVWPPVAVVHVAFQVMVGIGLLLVALAVIGLWLRWRNHEWPLRRWYLRLIALAAPLGFVAIEAGWTVTEVGRQPWVIHGILRTSEAVTPMPGLAVPFLVFTILYLLLAVIVFVLMRRYVFASPSRGELEKA